MGLSVEQVGRLIEVVRDSSLGVTFTERMQAISHSLAQVIPLDQLHTYTCDQQTWGPAPEGGVALARSPASRALGALTGGYYFENYDLALTETYATEFAATDAFGRAAVLTYPGTTLTSSRYVSDLDYRRGRGFGAFLRYAKVRYMMGILIPMSGDLRLLFGPARFPGRADFSPDEQRALGLLAPHLARAATEVLLAQAGPATGGPVLPARAGLATFDARGVLLQADAAASRLLEHLIPDPNSPGLASTVCALLREGAVVERTLVLGRSTGRVVVATLSVLESRPVGSTAVVLLEQPASGTPEHVDAESRLHHLTPREREVAALAALGLDQEDIADRLGLSLPTTKLHLGRCYDKLHVSGQAALAARLLGGSGA